MSFESYVTLKPFETEIYRFIFHFNKSQKSIEERSDKKNPHNTIKGTHIWIVKRVQHVNMYAMCLCATRRTTTRKILFPCQSMYGCCRLEWN